MFEQEKIPYEPSLSKRFQISEDVFSKERLYSLLKYREASKFYVLIALGYAVGIASLVD